MTAATRVRVAVVGATGYAGAELLRLLAAHPGVEVTTVTSEQDAGSPLASVHPGLAGLELELVSASVDNIVGNAELAFVALPHGSSGPLVSGLLAAGLRVVDLGADFRFDSLDVYQQWYGDHPCPELLEGAVYGLSEFARSELAEARLVANPGCYPTGALFGLLPLAGQTRGPIIIDSKSGTSGAGRAALREGLFAEVNENVKPYNVGEHRHQPEMVEKLEAHGVDASRLLFTPQLLPLSRGLLSHCYVAPAEGLDVSGAFSRAYADEPFVRLLGGEGVPSLARVRGTNMVEIAWREHSQSGLLLVMTAIDNLGKGAAGQAVQNMNLMLGLDETAGLLAIAALP
ncbi:MAG TPA: N-acetyl-gamma-glutamyl-phosphate reductase [Deltaproteobacteria bacterium]|nr:N-acetyl-gamma-glutamyl-phosphate reductase [Candidatus Binatota bacterium]HIL12289.1 N-acetyl-gamma-glutamyl-phosphate reductase [Deltaproteobacteria bacterium]